MKDRLTDSLGMKLYYRPTIGPGAAEMTQLVGEMTKIETRYAAVQAKLKELLGIQPGKPIGMELYYRPVFGPVAEESTKLVVESGELEKRHDEIQARLKALLN